MKRLASIAIVTALFLLSGFEPSVAQSKQGAKQTTPPPATSQEVEISGRSPEKPLEWPEPWPAPLPKPAGTPDEVATDLAKIVLAGGPDTLPALERAALESGFSIHDETGKVLFMPEDASDIGLSMLNFDLVIASENAKTKQKIRVGDLEHGIRENDELKDLSLPDAFGESMKADLDEFHPGLRFWAQFVSSLSSESDGDFDAVAVCDDDSEICGPQATWLLYLSAGQAAAGLLPPAEQPDNPPLASHRANPSPGLDVAQSASPAFRNLSRSLSQQQRSTIAQKIQQSQSQLDPQMKFLNEVLRLARSQFVHITAAYHNPPLIHTKEYGQLGGEMIVEFVPVLKVPAKFRSKYQAAMATVPGAHPMPPDSTLTIDDLDITDGDDLYTVAEKHLKVAGGYLRLKGTKQERHLVAKPVAEDFKIPSHGLITYADPAFGSEQFFDNVPYRDWHNPGGVLTVRMSVHGSGTLKNPDGGATMHWTINRKAEAKAVLTQNVPIAMYAIGGSKQGDAGVSSWIPSFDPNLITTHWKFMIDDEDTITAPVGGCGAKDGETATGTDTVKDRAPSAEETEFLKVLGVGVQVNKAKKESFHASLPAAPVKRKDSGTTPRNDTMDMLEGVEVTPPSGVRLDHAIEVDDAGGAEISVAISGKLAGYDKWGGQADAHRVAVTITYHIEPGATAANQPTLTLEQIRSLIALQTRQLLAGSTSKAKVRGGSSGNILVSGPVWVRKGPAITCSEIVIRDKMPTKKKSSIGTK